MRQRQSDLEATMDFQMTAAQLPRHVHEFRFCQRKWRADFAWPEDGRKVLLEVEGFGHHKLNRYRGDIEKYNEAAILGFCVIRVTGKMIRDGTALQLIERALKREEER